MADAVPFIDFKDQQKRLEKELAAAVAGVFATQQFVLKDNVAALEAAVAQKLGAKHAIGVASGSDALYLVLWALGIGPGDEVIVPPFTFFATAGAVSRTGARPVFADVDPATFNLDPAKVEKAITPRTKAVIPVHLFGLCADMDALARAADKRGIPLIEDAAQSFGARIGGRQSASIGVAGCLSFFPTKNLGGAGDGGMVTTRSSELNEKIRLLRVHGSQRKYHHELIGINSRLDEIQAAVLLVKMKYIDEWNRARRAHAAAYDKGLAGLPVKTPFVPAGYEHIYHLYSIRTPKRDALAEHLAKKGVGCGVYYPVPLHEQECYRSLGHKKGDFPVTEQLCAEILSLPMFPELTEPQRAAVVSAVRSFFA